MLWIEVKPGEFAVPTRVAFDQDMPCATIWFGEYRSLRLDPIRTDRLRTQIKKSCVNLLTNEEEEELTRGKK